MQGYEIDSNEVTVILMLQLLLAYIASMLDASSVAIGVGCSSPSQARSF